VTGSYVCMYVVFVVVECWPFLLNMLLSACCMSRAAKDFILHSVGYWSHRWHSAWTL